MSVNDFASFFDEMGPGQDVSVGGKELDLIKIILANITREQELAKTPVFDEILTKIQALGDQEIDGEFAKLSPALQALRGGISGENAESSLGGQMGQNGQNGQQHEQQSKEQYRQAMQAMQTGADVTAAGKEVSVTVQGYGGQESFARQISQKILYSHNKGIHRLRMKLNPERMGGLDIELKVKNGELTAHIKAESREAYEALAADIDSLKESLAEGGVKLGNMTLAFDDQENGRREFADLGLRGPKRNIQDETENIDPAIISQMAQMAAHDGLFSRIA
jgi:flagellar hook-length control protein FliK